jgi:hypothetical protein
MILHVQALMSCDSMTIYIIPLTLESKRVLFGVTNSVSPFKVITYELSKIRKFNVKVQSYTEVASKQYLLMMLASSICKYLNLF